MSLYKRILAACNNLHGWCVPGKQVTLANLVLAIDAKLIVEIGVWGGQSLFPLAMAAASKGPCRVIGIDAWKASDSIQGQGDKDAEWWQNQEQHDVVYLSFMEHRAKLGLDSIISVIRKTSNEVEPPDNIDLLHIDGNHGPQALIDTVRFAPKVRVGGFCVLDDLDWGGGNVGKAAEWLKAHGFMELHPLGTGAVYLRL